MIDFENFESHELNISDDDYKEVMALYEKLRDTAVDPFLRSESDDYSEDLNIYFPKFMEIYGKLQQFYLEKIKGPAEITLLRQFRETIDSDSWKFGSESREKWDSVGDNLEKLPKKLEVLNKDFVKYRAVLEQVCGPVILSDFLANSLFIAVQDNIDVKHDKIYFIIDTLEGLMSDINFTLEFHNDDNWKVIKAEDIEKMK